MANQHILLVEDDDILSKVVHEELSDAGFKVTVAHDGERGLEAAQNKLPDLILLDLLLPKMHGFDVLEELKRSPATQAIPVIVLTMLGSDEDIKKGLEIGANDYIVKSQHPVGEIVEKVHDFFGQEAHPEAERGEVQEEQAEGAPKDTGKHYPKYSGDAE